MTQSIAITDSMFNFGQFLTKNAITFDQKEIERKKKISRRDEILLCIQCCHQNVKIARKKKSTFFQKNFQQNRHFSKKCRFLENIKYIVRFWRFFPSFWLLIYLFMSNNKAMNQLFPTLCWIHEKNMKIMWTIYFETPLTAKNHDPPIKKLFSTHGVKLFFGKSPQCTIM